MGVSVMHSRMKLRCGLLAISLITLTPNQAIGQVSNGQPVNAATTNGAYLFKNSNDTALNQLSLGNTVTASGSSITNIQREFNSLSSFTGKPINQVFNYTPVWSNSDVGTTSDSVKARADDITAEFNSTGGHKHTGAFGDAPKISLTSSVSGTLPVANGGTALTSGTSGGILGYTASGILASSGALTANQLVIGGGSGVVPSSLAAGSQYQVLTMSASSPGYGALSLNQSAAVSGQLAIGNGGTGQATANAGFNALSPMTTLGDIVYENSTPIGARLPGNTSSTKNFLTQTGTGSVSAAPAWGTIANTDLSGITNTQLSGSAAISNANLATMTTLTLKGNNSGSTATPSDLTVSQVNTMLGTLSNPMTTGGDLIYGGSSGTPTRLANGSSGQFLESQGTTLAPIWATITATASYNIKSKTSTYTAIANDYVIASSSSFTITLPTAVGVSGQSIVIQHNGTTRTQVYTLATTSSQTIGGIAGGSVNLSSAGEIIVVTSDNSNWQITSHVVVTEGSHASGQERIERALVTDSGSACSVTSQSGAWLGSCTRGGAGSYTVAIVSGMFSAAPVCIPNASSTNLNCVAKATTATSLPVECLDVTGTDAQSNFNVICMGPR